MTQVEALAHFVTRATYEDLSDSVRQQLKIRVLDAVGCAVAAIEGMPLQALKQLIASFEPNGPCRLIGGDATSPSAAAFYNSALVRYWDFNDSYLAGEDSCHPSDNLGAVLAATQYKRGTGAEFLTALAVAYQVQCRFCDAAPLRDRGFDESTYGSYSVAAGVSKALALDEAQTANAIAMCGASFNALRVTRTDRLSNWESLAFGHMSAGCIRLALLAMHGVTGPLTLLEGEKGFMDAIAGGFEIDWSRENLDRVLRTIVKAHDTNVYSQTVIECALSLKQQHGFSGADVAHVDVDVFDVAYHTSGGGDESRYAYDVETREQACQSLPYSTAAALLDGELTPAQYAPDRIRSTDIQSLLKRVTVRPNRAYSDRYPDELRCCVDVQLRNGRNLTGDASGCPGFPTQPPSWDWTVRKFERLSQPYAANQLRHEIAQTIYNLEDARIEDLMRLLSAVHPSSSESEGARYV